MPTTFSKTFSASAAAALALAGASQAEGSHLFASPFDGRTSAPTAAGDVAPLLAVPLKRVADPSRGDSYMTEIVFGTGSEPQTVDVLVDTGSSELWLNPACAQSDRPEPCEGSGSYNPAQSPTSRRLAQNGGDFSATDSAGQILGDYYSDDVFISGARIRGQRFGVANATDRSWFGVMGLGKGPAAGDDSSAEFPLIMDSIVSQSHARSRMFSLDLGSDSDEGQMIFGGVDANRFSGNLVKVPTDRTDGKHYKIDLHGISVSAPEAIMSHVQSASLAQPVPVVIDSSSSMSVLPDDVVDAVVGHFRDAVWDSGSGNYVVDCKHRALKGSIAFDFHSAQVKVPYADFILDAEKGGDASSVAPRCFLGVNPFGKIMQRDDAEEKPFVLGASFLRGAYVAFDQANDALYMANYERCGSGASAPVAVPEGVDAAAKILGNCGRDGSESEEDVISSLKVRENRDITITATAKATTGDENTMEATEAEQEVEEACEEEEEEEDEEEEEGEAAAAPLASASVKTQLLSPEVVPLSSVAAQGSVPSSFPASPMPQQINATQVSQLAGHQLSSAPVPVATTELAHNEQAGQAAPTADSAATALTHTVTEACEEEEVQTVTVSSCAQEAATAECHPGMETTTVVTVTRYSTSVVAGTAPAPATPVSGTPTPISAAPGSGSSSDFPYPSSMIAGGVHNISGSVFPLPSASPIAGSSPAPPMPAVTYPAAPAPVPISGAPGQQPQQVHSAPPMGSYSYINGTHQIMGTASGASAQWITASKPAASLTYQMPTPSPVPIGGGGSPDNAGGAAGENNPNATPISGSGSNGASAPGATPHSGSAEGATPGVAQGGAVATSSGGILGAAAAAVAAVLVLLG